jgi:hypothetical protein
MQHHTVQQLNEGPRAGKYIYTGGNRRMGRYVECCAELYHQIMELPEGERDSSPLWEHIGHDTAEAAYAHMRAVLLDRLDLDGKSSNWGGCRAPVEDGKCDSPTKGRASIPPMYFLAHLCDEHRMREVVEAMWDGPGDWSGSY